MYVSVKTIMMIVIIFSSNVDTKILRIMDAKIRTKSLHSSHLIAFDKMEY